MSILEPPMHPPGELPTMKEVNDAMETPGRIVCNDDGYLIVGTGDGAQMACPTERLEWRMRYGDAPALVAASVVDSFNYLINNCSQKEALRRLKIMRTAMRQKPSK